MNYDLEHLKELTGTLITLDDSAVITDVFLQMDTSTASKIASVLRSNRGTRENQDWFFTNISISGSGLDTFTKVQISVVKNGDRYHISTAQRNPVRFKGILQTIVRGSDGFDYACNIEIGNIGFDIMDKAPAINDDIASFENVPAIIYPHGKYQAVVIQDED